MHGMYNEQYKIDYVAHDADPYFSAGHDDVYAYCKMQGKSRLLTFPLPTSLISPL